MKAPRSPVRHAVAEPNPMCWPDPLIVAELVTRSRKASGVPPTVTDPVALARIAAILKGLAA